MSAFGARATRRLLFAAALLAPLMPLATTPAHAAPPVTSVTAADYGYPYPSAPDCDETTGDNCLPDQWGFIQGQCHSWVAYRLNELNAAQLHGVTFNDDYRMTGGNTWGNPPNWPTAAQEAGIAVDSTPALGSVAWWSSDGGHVAYVEAVNSDGSVTISEMNPDYHNGFDFATLTPGGRWPEAFIHIADRPPVRTATAFTIAVNGASSSSVPFGSSVTLSESGINATARGPVVFSSAGHSSLCTITLPATTCVVPGPLAVGSYTPITASFTDTDGGYTNASSSNSVSLIVAAAPRVPTAPGSPRAVGASGAVTVTWTAPADDGGTPITGYTIEVSPGGRAVIAPASATSATITGLEPGNYVFTVCARNGVGAGAYSTASNPVVVPAKKPPLRVGYWMLGAGGRVYAFGDSVRYGDAPGPMVAMASRRDGLGYWTVDARGRVSSFGAAAAHGGSPLLIVGESVSTIAATPSGDGYWLFTTRGRAFRYGDARVYGDMANVHLNGPIVASAATATGKGYYMVGSDGGVFSFGDAHFHGSTGALHLNRPVVGISPTPDNKGYYLVASDGGVFAFGAPFRGSMGRVRLNQPVNGLVAFGNGYLMVASDGGIFDFSNQPFFGSLAGQALPAPVIGMSAFTSH